MAVATTLPERPKSTSNRTGSYAIKVLPLVPAILILLAFMGTTVVWSLWGSLTNLSLSGPNAANPAFIGLGNYVNLLSDPDFPKSVWLTVLFVVASGVIGQNVLGLGLAVMMKTCSAFVRNLTSTLVVAAWVIPDVVACYVAYAYFSKSGTLNAMLGWLGVAPTDWLYNLPMVAVVLANTWRGTAFSMMVYSAALKNIPQEIEEAAEMDGAGPWKTLTGVTIPMLRRSISTNLMLTTLQTVSVFTLIYVMTAGGPGTSSSTLPVLAYQEAFKFSNVGYGTAIATVLLAIGALFSIAYIKILKPAVD